MTVATRGPVPGRSDTTRRTNHKAEIEKTEDRKVELPYEAKVGWTKSVIRLWGSLAESGMAQYYTSSDWAMAFIILDTLDLSLRSENHMTGQISFTAVNACLSQLARFGVTEGDRRRMRIELEKTDSEEAVKAAIQESYQGLRLVPVAPVAA